MQRQEGLTPVRGGNPFLQENEHSIYVPDGVDPAGEFKVR